MTAPTARHRSAPAEKFRPLVGDPHSEGDPGFPKQFPAPFRELAPSGSKQIARSERTLVQGAPKDDEDAHVARVAGAQGGSAHGPDNTAPIAPPRVRAEVLEQKGSRLHAKLLKGVGPAEAPSTLR